MGGGGLGGHSIPDRLLFRLFDGQLGQLRRDLLGHDLSNSDLTAFADAAWRCTGDKGCSGAINTYFALLVDGCDLHIGGAPFYLIVAGIRGRQCVGQYD